jgi:hypothetical protein
MRKYLILSLMFLTAVIGCKKQSGLQTVVAVSATIHYTGDPAADGCGWLIKPDNENATFKPINLSDNYKTDNAKVTISYLILSTNYTGCVQVPGGAGMNQIEIKSIAFR